jgi:hypothetical protein
LRLALDESPTQTLHLLPQLTMPFQYCYKRPISDSILKALTVNRYDCQDR